MKLGRLIDDSQCLKPDPGNPAVRDYRGAFGNVAMVENEIPTRKSKERIGNPSPTAVAPEFYPNYQWLGLSSFEKTILQDADSLQAEEGKTSNDANRESLFGPA